MQTRHQLPKVVEAYHHVNMHSMHAMQTGNQLSRITHTGIKNASLTESLVQNS